MENKLITLFKQCCDNHDFIKEHDQKGFRDYHQPFLLENQPFVLSEEVSRLISDGGYEVRKTPDNYSSDQYGRLFEFDDEPPLRLSSAKIRLDLLMDEKHITIGELIKDKFTQTVNKYIDSFWGNKTYKDVKERVNFSRRLVTIDLGIAEANHRIWLNNQIEDAFTFCPRGFHRENKNLYMSHQFNKRKAEEWFFHKEHHIIQDGMYSSYIDDVDRVMEFLRNDTVMVKGGILSFGDVWLWVEYEEYVELEKYYIDSIKKTHAVILDKRINETK